MDYDRLDPGLVQVPKRLRSVASTKVDRLAESMAAIGLRQPSTVWSNAPDHLELVAGAHRLAAAIKLGWLQIDVISVDDMTEIDRQLWEIDENLMRAELNPTELGEHITRREKLWGERSEVGGKTLPTHDATGRKKTPQQTKGFAADTAKKTGMSKRAINLAKSRTEKIPEDVRDQIKGTKLDTGTYLDWIKGMDPDDQRTQVKADLAEGVKPKIPKPPKVDTSEDQFEALKRASIQLSAAVAAASPEARSRFFAWQNEQENLEIDVADHEHVVEILGGAS